MIPPIHHRARSLPAGALWALLLGFAALAVPARAAAADKATKVDVSNPYALQLMLTTRFPDPGALPDLTILRTHRLYTTSYTRDGVVWYRLRLGFFATANEAARHQAELEPFFPGNWVTRVPWSERSGSADTAIVPAGAKPPTPTPAPSKAGPPAISKARLDELMESARQALAEGHYSDAIRTYTKVLEYPKHARSRDALELLGLARERNGQAAHAKAVYERYLARYPEGEASDRVRQRLAGLLTAREPLPEKLRAPKDEAKAARWDTFGGVSQFYRRSTFTDPLGTSRVVQSALATDLDLTARRRTESMDFRTRLSAGYVYDMLSDGPGDDKRVSSLYAEASRRTSNLSARLGRQSRSTGGVLGRFDGLLVNLGVLPRTSLSLVGGFPVESSTIMRVQTDKVVYGATLNLGTFAEAFDMNVYYVAQQVDSVADREAVGGELRYFRPTRSLFTLVDYDILFEALNTFLLVGSWTSAAGTTWNLTLDERRSPVLTTSNALIGQPLVDSVDGLLATGLTEEQVRQMALDQTSTLRSATLGASAPLNSKFQVSGDVTVSDGTGTTGVSFPVIVDPIPATHSYAVATDLTGSSLITDGDIAIVGLRYTNTESSNTSSLNLNTRYPINHAWRVNPRVRFDFRRNERDGTDQWTTSPSLRLEYRAMRRVQFEVEGSGEWSTRHLSTDTERTSAFFLSAGYRLDF
jgi:tetratricopeptide (TPR) repeat protein